MLLMEFGITKIEVVPSIAADLVKGSVEFLFEDDRFASGGVGQRITIGTWATCPAQTSLADLQEALLAAAVSQLRQALAASEGRTAAELVRQTLAREE
jgi:hypothetical protein